MKLTLETVEKYLKSMGRNYSIVFTYDKGPLNQLKVHFAPHVGEFYYSFRNEQSLDVSAYTQIDLNEVSNISFYAGLLISSFQKEDFGVVLQHIENSEHFPVHRPEILNRNKESDQPSEEEGNDKSKPSADAS